MNRELKYYKKYDRNQLRLFDLNLTDYDYERYDGEYGEIITKLLTLYSNYAWNIVDVIDTIENYYDEVFYDSTFNELFESELFDDLIEIFEKLNPIKYTENPENLTHILYEK